MGGFTLYDKQGIPLRILEYSELETLSEAGKIAWPSITEGEIQDRSKSDYLSKGVVAVQLGWFYTQFFARTGYRLDVTALEMVTLLFTMNGIVAYISKLAFYFFAFRRFSAFNQFGKKRKAEKQKSYLCINKLG